MSRIIKLQPDLQKGKFATINKMFHKLTLNGNLLNSAGFHPSKMIKVTSENGKLIVTEINEY